MSRQLRPLPDRQQIMEPVEPVGVVRNVTNASLGAFSALGNLLDVPGAVVRNTLSGRNPLTPLLSPLTQEGRTTGGDMLRSAGLIGHEDTWANLPARLLTEFALDPMTYLTPGTHAAATAAGKAARATGAIEMAADVATARAMAHAAKEAAPLASKVLQQATEALAPKVGSQSAEELAKASIARSTPATVSVGRRQALRSLTLNQLIEGLPDDVVQLAGHGSNRAVTAPSVTRGIVMKNLDDYAKKLKYADAAEFIARHGDEVLAKDAALGLPFTKSKALFSYGRTGDSLARYLDLAESAARWSLPGRAVAMLFGSGNLDQISRQGQEIAQGVTSRRRAIEPHVAKEIYDRIAEMESIIPDFNKTFSNEKFSLPGQTAAEYSIDSLDKARDALGRVVRLAHEISKNSASASDSQSLQRAISTLLPGSSASALPVDATRKLEEMIGKLREAKDSVYSDWIEGGGKGDMIDFDWLSHFPRYAVAKDFSEDYAFKTRLVPSAGIATAAREKSIAALPAEVIHSVLADDLARANKLPAAIQQALANANAAGIPVQAPKFGADRVKEIIQDWTGDIKIDLPDGTQKVIGLDEQAKQLHEYARSASKDFMADRRMFSNSPLEDFAKYLASAHRLVATRDAAFTTLLRSSDDLAKFQNYTGQTETIAQVLKGAGYEANKAALRMAKMAGATDPVKHANDLLGMSVPKEVAEAIVSLNTKSNSPRWAQAMGFYWDKATRVLKENLTLPFPGFWVRNFFSGQFMNMMSNHVESVDDLAEYHDAFKLADQIRKDPAKFESALRELHAMDVYKYGYHAADIPEHVKLANVAPLPIIDKAGILNAANEAIAKQGETWIETALGRFPKAQQAAGAALNPLRKAHQFVLETGRRVSAMGEWYNRVPMYLYLKEKGYAPEIAAQIVKDIHVDYADLTKFEKSGMRRAALFYTFSRKQLEQTAKRIFEQPGGVPGLSIAGTIKAVNRARDPGELLPDYVAETASIPMGQDDQGNRSYLTGLGLAFEDPMQFFGKGLQGAGIEALSRLNPMLKTPLEYATNELFFQSGPGGGRDLPDADPLLGRTLANITGRETPYKIDPLVEVAIANSPASRLVSSTRQLFDPRRNVLQSAANLLTGIRTTVVSPAATDAILRERVNEQLRATGARQFIRTYVPENVKATMTPQQIEESAQLVDTLNELARRAKARKKFKQEDAAKILSGQQ